MASASPEELTVVEIAAAWQYRWGDSPREPNGQLLYARPELETGWLPTNRTRNLPGRKDQRFLWLRARLDGPQVAVPYLQLGIVEQLYEAYLDGQLIHRFGDFEGPAALRFAGYPLHLIPLPAAYQGKILTLRIYSSYINIGLTAFARIGTLLGIVRVMTREDASRAAIVVLAIALGLVVLALSLVRRGQRIYLYYAGFAIGSGVLMAMQLQFKYWLWPDPLGWAWSGVCATYLSVTCLMFFFAQVFERRPIGFARLLGLASAVYTSGAVLLAAVGIVPLMSTLVPYQFMMLIMILYALPYSILQAVRGDSDARLLTIGFVSLVGFSSYQMLQDLGFMARSLSVLHYGQFIFIVALGGIMIRRFLRIQLERELAQRQVAEQSVLLHAAARMAGGDLSSEIQVPTQHELAPLASALDGMRGDIKAKVAALETRNREVQELNDELRRQISAHSRSLMEALGGRGSSGSWARPLQSGEPLGDHYRIVRLIGSGGMGAVYEVERTTDGRRLAAKVLKGTPDRALLSRFAREAQIMSRLAHENLIAIADVDATAEGVLYIVMELIAGRSLVGLRDRFGDVPWGLAILRQVATALGVLHASGIVHRDLKPENVLLAETQANRPLIKLADFGIASLAEEAPPTSPKDSAAPTETSDPMAGTDMALIPTAGPRFASDLENLTQTGQIMGTPNYIAPELLKGSRHAQPSADMWSFGVMAFEVLCRRLPFSRPALELIARGESLAVPNLLRDCRELPTEIAALIERCLSIDPGERPSAEQLAQKLSATDSSGADRGS